MSVKVYKTVLLQQVMKGRAFTEQMKPLAQSAARQKFDAAQKQALVMFNSHPITKEIEGGGTAENISDTLHFPEAAKKGNLYSFIGFPGISAANMGGMRTLMTAYPRLRKSGTKARRVGTDRVDFTFRTQIPSLQAFYAITPMPWPEGGQSWAQKVETGFSNLHFYKYKQGIPGSRSGYAIQLEKWGVYLPGSYFKPKPYLSGIMGWWANELSRHVIMTVSSIKAGRAMAGKSGKAKMRPGEAVWMNPFGTGGRG